MVAASADGTRSHACAQSACQQVTCREVGPRVFAPIFRLLPQASLGIPAGVWSESERGVPGAGRCRERFR